MLFLLSFLLLLVVTALIIKLADLFFCGFQVNFFKAALVMAIVLAFAGALFRRLIR